MAEDRDIQENALEEAVDWLLTPGGEPEGGTREAEFHRWLDARPENRPAWERACRSWRAMGKLAPERNGDIAMAEIATGAQTGSHARRRLHAFSPSRRGFVVTAAISMAACLLVVLLAPGFILRFSADYVTDTAQSRRITLEDGTNVELGAYSALRSWISPTGRHVRLLGGEAWFDVAHDAARPFTVEAGGADITVLGTAFNVSMSSSGTTVGLERGSVNFSREGDNGDHGVTLAPGDTATLIRKSGAVERGTLPVTDMGAWREGMLFVNNATIGEVVEQLQRYHPAWITVPDGTLAARRVTGLYDLRDPDRALHALVEPYGGKVRAVSPWGRVLTGF